MTHREAGDDANGFSINDSTLYTFTPYFKWEPTKRLELAAEVGYCCFI